MTARLLIVEDEETLRESLQRVLRQEGYEVDSVDNSEAALELIRRRSYDLVVTDIILPAMNGIELVKACRQQNPGIILVVITAFASIETAVEAIRAGAYDYLIKPVIHEEIKRIIRRALEEKSSGSS